MEVVVERDSQSFAGSQLIHLVRQCFIRFQLELSIQSLPNAYFRENGILMRSLFMCIISYNERRVG